MKIEKTRQPKPKPAPNALGFGKHFTDHMLRLDFDGGWSEPAIVPYGPISLEPAAAAFHYGQAIFEGFKAFPGTLGAAPRLFRPADHLRRLNASAARVCMPP